jgi:hypothetical protein
VIGLLGLEPPLTSTFGLVELAFAGSGAGRRHDCDESPSIGSSKAEGVRQVEQV